MFCGALESEDDLTHCCHGNTAVDASLQMLAPLSARWVKDVVSSFTGPRRAFAFVPRRSQEQPCVIPDSTQAHQIFIFHQTLRTRNRRHVQSEWCHFCSCGPTSRSHIWLKGRRGTLAPWWRHLESTTPPFIVGFWKTCWMYGHMASASDTYSTQSEQASIADNRKSVCHTASRAAVTACL